MTTITTVKAREHFSDLINRAAYGKERVILKRRGKNIVAVIPLEDLALLEEIENELDLHDARLALKEVRKKGTLSLKALKEKLAKN